MSNQEERGHMSSEMQLREKVADIISLAHKQLGERERKASDSQGPRDDGLDRYHYANQIMDTFDPIRTAAMDLLWEVDMIDKQHPSRAEIKKLKAAAAKLKEAMG